MSIKYQMWLTYNAEKEKIRLPVLPEKFPCKIGSNNSSVNIAELGEIIIMQSRPAFQFTIESFFPATYFPGAQTLIPTAPLVLIQKLKNWKSGKDPIHLICTACGVDTYCAIESFEYYEKGGDVGTYYYTLTLKEYREVTIRQVTVDEETETATVQSEDVRVDNSVVPETYTIESGDSLYNIAKKYYGDGSKYTEIYEANKDTIGNNPNLIYAGTVLNMP